MRARVFVARVLRDDGRPEAEQYEAMPRSASEKRHLYLVVYIARIRREYYMSTVPRPAQTQSRKRRNPRRLEKSCEERFARGSAFIHARQREQRLFRGQEGLYLSGELIYSATVVVSICLCVALLREKQSPAAGLSVGRQVYECVLVLVGPGSVRFTV